MTKNRAAILGLMLAVAAPARSDVVIHLHRSGTTAAPVKGTIEAQNAADPSRSLSFRLPAASIPLPPGEWFVSARIEGEWSEPCLISVNDSPQQADLNTFPLARLRARVALPNGRKAQSLQAYFQRVVVDDTGTPAEGSVACEVANGTATCNLPAGEFDLTFRISGYVSRYRWNAALKPRSLFDAGTLNFVSGSTLTGRVEVPGNKAAHLDRVSVIVKPSAIAGANGEQRHRADAARLVAQPNRRGIFAFDLPPGQFTIQASYNDLISEEMTVDVAAGRESSLRSALRLEPQRIVTIRVNPALDPWSKPWTVEFASVDPTGFLLSERSLKTAADGSCRFANVLPGPHRITVVRASNQSWASRMLDIDRDTTIDLNVDVVRLTGTIRVGSKPIAATARLTSIEHGASVVVRSKADGTFAARLPAPDHDTWDEIALEADLPAVKRTLKNVQFHRHDDGSSVLDLELPARSITGTVVDDLGRPTAPALIDVVFPDQSLQQIMSSDGSFVLTGLPSGRHRLRAASKELESIDLQDVTLAEDDDAAADVMLPLAPVTHLRGTIRALEGPALGSALYATAPGDTTRPVILSRVDPEGRFDIRFPAATREVMVAINAPGFAFRLGRVPVTTDEQTFAVEQNGGTLIVDGPSVRSGRRPYLLHNGGTLSALAAAYVAGATFNANLSERVAFRIASAEPGPYSLCWLADGSSAPSNAPCISGVLAPHGTLTLAE